MHNKLTADGLPFFQLTRVKFCAVTRRTQGTSAEFELDMEPASKLRVSLAAAAILGRLAAGVARAHDRAALVKCGAWPHGIDPQCVVHVSLLSVPTFSVRYRVQQGLEHIEHTWYKPLLIALDNIMSAPEQSIATASLTTISEALGFPLAAVRAGNNPASCLSTPHK